MKAILLLEVNRQMTVEPLERFIKAQDCAYELALAEIKQGKKSNHWMWYIFPQLIGLGFSDTAKHYGIKDLAQAEAYLQHPILGKRLVEISNELLKLEITDPQLIFDSPDDLKLKSSMTLFALVKDTDEVFEKVLAKFFNGIKDSKTLYFCAPI